jgi:NAD(P)-dependent dehydrogenase (short-subunit alcohol dehydrogenase family)
MPDLFKAALAKIPWGHTATAEEVANAAVFLCSWRFSEVPSATLLVRFQPDCGHQQTATTAEPFMSSPA